MPTLLVLRIIEKYPLQISNEFAVADEEGKFMLAILEDVNVAQEITYGQVVELPEVLPPH